MKNIFALHQAQAKDQRIINNLVEAFQNNDRMRVTLGNRNANFLQKINQIISYSYFMVKKIGGLFISKDQHTYLLYYTKSKFYFSLKDYFNYVYLALVTIGIKQLKTVYLREQNIKNIRQKEIEIQGDKDYLYVWYLAQKKEHKSLKGLMEAKSFIIENALKLNLPIYIETTEKRLVPIYERAGFQFYDCMIEEDTALCVWFGRYCLNQSSKSNSVKNYIAS